TARVGWSPRSAAARTSRGRTEPAFHGTHKEQRVSSTPPLPYRLTPGGPASEDDDGGRLTAQSLCDEPSTVVLNSDGAEQAPHSDAVQEPFSARGVPESCLRVARTASTRATSTPTPDRKSVV